MYATSLLKHDHDEFKEMFESFESAESPTEKRQILDQIISELEKHTRIEEEIFYPAVQAEVRTLEALVREGVEEHHVVDQIMDELKTMAPDDPQFEAKVTVLKENVEHHVEEEEQEMFPQVEATLAVDRLSELGAAMAEAKGESGSGGGSEDLSGLSKDELNTKAQDLEIPGRSEMTKEELADANSSSGS